jgi:protease IV
MNEEHPDSDSSRPPHWERQILERLAFSALQEQKSRRRWGIFFKSLGFAYLAGLLIILGGWGPEEEARQLRHTALVNLKGVIAQEGDASAENVISALQEAFKDDKTAGVILRVNSPGGSPVQSGIIYDEIRRLRGKYPEKPLHVVVEDVCASGGYFVAAAADKIFVNRASVVGSIGVLMDGFGFTGAMDKLGVERRLLTAGENKGFLDPFSPQESRHREHAQVLLDDIHKQFIEVVRRGRGERLKETPDMFSGLMWTGQRSVELGLADGFGTVDSVAREVIKVEPVVDYTIKSSLADRLARRFGAGAGETLAATLGGAFRLY